MCFYKEGATKKVVLQDTYILKDSSQSEVLQDIFISEIKSFIYNKGIRYTKNFWHKMVAYFSSFLEGQVYHTHNIEKSKDVEISSRNKYWRSEYGVFKIPKNTTVYINSAFREIAS